MPSALEPHSLLRYPLYSSEWDKSLSPPGGAARAGQPNSELSDPIVPESPGAAELPLCPGGLLSKG